MVNVWNKLCKLCAIIFGVAAVLLLYWVSGYGNDMCGEGERWMKKKIPGSRALLNL